jgi:hypothetical protein
MTEYLQKNNVQLDLLLNEVRILMPQPRGYELAASAVKNFCLKHDDTPLSEVVRPIIDEGLKQKNENLGDILRMCKTIVDPSHGQDALGLVVIAKALKCDISNVLEQLSLFCNINGAYWASSDGEFEKLALLLDMPISAFSREKRMAITSKT